MAHHHSNPSDVKEEEKPIPVPPIASPGDFARPLTRVSNTEYDRVPESVAREFSNQGLPCTTTDDQDVTKAVLVGGLRTVTTPCVNIEKESIDGAVVLLPQVARSLDWHHEVSVFVITSFIVSMLHYISAFSLILFINKEENVFDFFAGQPSLCDFGINLDRCATESNDPACIGPDGTSTTAPRLYSYTLWAARKFARDSLKALFPDMIDDINKLVDPGEYGVESYWCRVLCCILFILSIKVEMYACKNLLKLLWYLPNQNQSWVRAKKYDSDENASGYNWEERVEVKVAGMSIGWKIWNTLFVLLPKTTLVLLTCDAGIDFLMDTSTIDDLIVNSVALGFILQLDNVMTECLLSPKAHKLLDMCESETFRQKGQNYHMSDEQLCQQFEDGRGNWKTIVFDVVARELTAVYIVLGVTAAFMAGYYWTRCEHKDGRWVSREIHMPQTTRYWVGNFFFPVPLQEEPVWC